LSSIPVGLWGHYSGEDKFFSLFMCQRVAFSFKSGRRGTERSKADQVDVGVSLICDERRQEVMPSIGEHLKNATNA
jgi:hypothetical protein